jgi:integrase
MKLTAQAVSKLRHEGTQAFRDVKDGGAPGLYLRIWQSGEKRWVMRYKVAGRTRVGTFTDAAGNKSAVTIPLGAARAWASAWHVIVRQGRDPAAEERRKEAAERRLPIVRAFAAEYLERHAKPNKRSWGEDQRLLSHDVLPVLGDLRLDTVTRRDIVTMLDAIRDRGADIVANRVIAVVRRMFGFAVERGVVESSPFVGIRAARERTRARVLTDDELRRLWAATAPGAPRIEPSTRMALRLLLLSGARASEVCGAPWLEFDVSAAEWLIPAARTKNGRAHSIPLSDMALDIVREAEALRPSKSRWLLPALGREGHVTPSGVLQAAQRILGEDMVVHDIRRSVATGLQRFGIRLEVTEALLNHVSGSRAGVVGIYQRHDWHQEKRAALDVWASYIERLAVGGDAGENVVRLPAVA